MPATMRLAAIAFLFTTSFALAQKPLEDPPQVLEKKPLTKAELKREQAETLLRLARTEYGLAVILQRHERLISAIGTLEKAANLDPDSLEVRRMLIPLYVQVGREEDAMTLCREVLDHEPHDSETAFQFAKLLKADGQSAKAITILQKAVISKDAQERPERLLFMLSDLYTLVDKKGDHAEAAKAQEAVIRTIDDKRDQLLYGNGFTREDLQGSLARAYERLGRARVQLKEYEKAALAFREARNTLLKSDDPDSRHQAVRISWNLSEMAASQENWAEALRELDAYLEHGPADIEPYEKKIEFLRKLGRDRDVIPGLRRYAERGESNLDLQLLLAKELAREPRATQREAEEIYLSLLRKNIKPETYRGLFKLYASENRMGEVLNMLDESVGKSSADAKVKPEERERAQERARAMLGVLRTDSTLVLALLPESLAEAGSEKKRNIDTLSVLATLAARTKQLDTAEKFFRDCLKGTTPEREFRVYAGLIEVLQLQHNDKEIVALCQDALSGRRLARNTNAVLFESSLATSLADLGEFDEAIVHARKAVKLTSEEFHVRSRNQLAEILARAGKFDEAISECQDTMKEFPEAKRVRSTRYSLANVYSLKGDHEKSEEQLRLILETNPDEALANNNLGYQMADRNINLEEAERLIRRAIEIDRIVRKDVGEFEENAAYLDSLGWVLFRRGKLAEARELLEKAVSLPDGANDAAVWDHIGDVYAKSELSAKAKDAWTKAAKLYDVSGRRKSDSRRSEVEKKLKTVE